MGKVTEKDLMNEQERRLKKLRQQEKDNKVDGNARRLFLEKPYYMQELAKSPVRKQNK